MAGTIKRGRKGNASLVSNDILKSKSAKIKEKIKAIWSVIEQFYVNAILSGTSSIFVKYTLLKSRYLNGGLANLIM